MSNLEARTKGLTISSLALGWLSLGGVGNGVLRLSSGEPLYQVLGALALLYAISAGIASVGLWRMLPVGIVAFRVWAILCFQFSLAAPWTIGTSWTMVLLSGVLLGAILFFWHRYLVAEVRAT